jgi:acetate kinase
LEVVPSVINKPSFMMPDTSGGQRILVINSGSSSIKYQLLRLPDEHLIAHGVLEDIGGSHSRFVLHRPDTRQPVCQHIMPIMDHCAAFRIMIQALGEFLNKKDEQGLAAIAHRVVHGGNRFVEPTLIDRTMLEALEGLSILAPLHNPANVQGIKDCLALFPGIPQVAVFDTAFHRTLPDYAYRYAIPDAWYRTYGIRRYGFHGCSHRYVAQKAAAYLNRPLAELNLITLHLGNGASVSAVEKGCCIDTSMGFTPLEGLMMGSRCGDIDASIPLYVQQISQLSADEVQTLLNYEAGLKGLAGTNDVRELLYREEQGDKNAALALAAYVYRIRKYIGAYSAVLGRLDVLVFTGGVGENAPDIRSRCCRNLDNLGIRIDAALNSAPINAGAAISSSDQFVQILVIPTNEELQIAYETWALLNSTN